MPFRIIGFPESIAEVPETPREWLIWRDKVLAFRELCHRKAEESDANKQRLMRLSAADPAFFMAIFGVIHDPKGEPDFQVDETGEIVKMRRRKGWYPWIPYPFQVEVLRFIAHVVSIEDEDSGKADAVIEKSRDVGLTWSFCLEASHGWLFGDDELTGFISYKEELVDSSHPKAMFFKVRAILGLNKKVPYRCHAPGTVFHGSRVRLPEWMLPEGFDPKEHDKKLSLIHPTKSNQITGESTSAKTGIGDRQGKVVLDEGSKNDKLESIYSGLEPVSEHRFVIGSAERRYGDGMYNLVRQAKLAQRNPDIAGPSLLSIPWWKHPLRDEAWYTRTKSRFAEGEAAFRREYEIDWNADIADLVYPSAQKIESGHYPFNPDGGDVAISIDPGIRDPSAITCFQYIPPTENEWTLFDALVIKTPSARFLAPILMGWPRGHEMRSAYPEYMDESIQDFMDVMWKLREKGHNRNFVGDPYGGNVGGAGDETFYSQLFLVSVELNQKYDTLPPAEIIVFINFDDSARYHRGRKEALTWMIPKLRPNDIARVNYVVEALRNYRYKPQEEGRSVQNEPMTPMHDWSSHPTTSCEYWANYSRIKAFSDMPNISLANTKKAKKAKSDRYRMEPGWTR